MFSPKYANRFFITSEVSRFSYETIAHHQASFGTGFVSRLIPTVILSTLSNVWWAAFILYNVTLVSGRDRDSKLALFIRFLHFVLCSIKFHCKPVVNQQFSVWFGWTFWTDPVKEFCLVLALVEEYRLYQRRMKKSKDIADQKEGWNESSFDSY